MKYEKIYFIKDYGYFSFYEIIILMLLAVSLIYFIKFTKFTIKLNRNKDEPKATNTLMVTIFIFFIVCLLLFFNLIAYNGYLNVIRIIDEKKYKIVKGKIINYQPTFITDKKFESFDVSGIHFVYSPAIRDYSFSQLKGEGNPIEEGTLVKLWYFQKKESQSNLILKFEYIP